MALALSADIAVRLLNSGAFATAENGFRRVRAAIDETSDSARAAQRELQMAAFAEKRAAGEARTAQMRREREAVLGPSPAERVAAQEAEALAQKAREARTALRELEQFGGKIRNLGIGLTAAITAPVVLFANTAVNAAADVEKAQNKVNIVFGQSAGIISDFGASAAQALGQSRAEALAAAGSFGLLFTNMGIGQEQAAGMSMSLVALASDLASFSKITPTAAMAKLQSGLIGRAMPLQRLGLDLSMATVKAKAMELGIEAVGGELSAQQKVFVRYQLMMEQTANIQGHFAKNSDDLANKQMTLAAQYNETAAALGKTLLPLKIKLVDMTNVILQRFDALPSSVQAAGWALLGLGAFIGPTLLVGGELIRTLASIQGMGGLAGIKIKLEAVSTAFRKGGGAIKAYGAKLIALEGRMMVGGPLLIGLAAVAAAIYLIWNEGKKADESIERLNKTLGITAQIGEDMGEKIGVSGAAQDVAVLTKNIKELDAEQLAVYRSLKTADPSMELKAPADWWGGFKATMAAFGSEERRLRMGGPEGMEAYQRYYKQLGTRREELLGLRQRAIGGEDIPLRIEHTQRWDPATGQILSEAYEMGGGNVPRRAMRNELSR